MLLLDSLKFIVTEVQCKLCVTRDVVNSCSQRISPSSLVAACLRFEHMNQNLTWIINENFCCTCLFKSAVLLNF